MIKIIYCYTWIFFELIMVLLCKVEQKWATLPLILFINTFSTAFLFYAWKENKPARVSFPALGINWKWHQYNILHLTQVLAWL